MANERLIEIAKANAIGTYTSSEDLASAKDYDDFMKLETDEDLMNSEFVIWEPFETYNLDSLQDYMSSEFSTTLELLNKALKTVLVNVNDINLGVEFTDNDGKTSTMETEQADIRECPKCGGTTIEYGDCEPEAYFIYRHHTCECGCNWDERYDLAIVHVEGAE